MEGRLTTAVIDAVYGTPANGMLVDLFRLPGGQAERQHLKTIETDARGRDAWTVVSAADV